MCTRRRFLAATGSALGVLAVSGRARGADPTSLAERVRHPAFEAWVLGQMKQGRVPGLTLAIIDGGQLVHSAAYGWADLEQRRPMTAQTLLNIASVTKTITGTAVMQLWEQRKFGLEDDVRAHVDIDVRHPAYPRVPITIRQLLTHTSSIADGPAYRASYGCGDAATPLNRWLQDYLQPGGQLYELKNFHDWQPGTYYAYSNVAYGVLGRLIEKASGLSYSEYCRRHVFEPLGMQRSRFELVGMDRSEHATPYRYVTDDELSSVRLADPAWHAPGQMDEGVWVPHCLYGFVTMADGGARTNSAEYSRLLLAYLNAWRGRGELPLLLQQKTVRQMFTDQHVQKAPAAATAVTQGLTWALKSQYGTGEIWGHSGADPGVATLAAIRPADGRGVVVIGHSSWRHNVSVEVAKYVFASN
ncbi:serine hydrolase domain-containing protein [Steroidobacter sp.]|uniref:serine hydrolase domain-containing protein n=1 Tax=Steroidobacter sp. TaxID=1978227 RepID=UPI0025FCA4ED|nr:serine hydrolase domain-containing protein [Steroidobacter sp.]